MKKPKISQNVKTKLAKLLAHEDISVDYDPKAKTAKFDLINRQVILPMLECTENYIHDAFIGHEVAHARWTPPKEYKKAFKVVPSAFINITEDARIEKLIQRYYSGIRPDFQKFYEEFAPQNRDFFGIKDKDLTKLTTIDRINLHFKLGIHVPHLVTIPFLPEEQKFVDMVAAEEEFDDALEAAKAIYAYMKEQNQEQPKEDDQEGPSQKGKGSGKGKSKKKDKQNGDSDGDNQHEGGEEESDNSDSEPGGQEDGDDDNSDGSGEESPGDDSDTGGSDAKKDKPDTSDSNSGTSGDTKENGKKEEGKGESKDSKSKPKEESNLNGEDVPDYKDAGITQKQFDDNFSNQLTNKDPAKVFGEAPSVADMPYKYIVDETVMENYAKFGKEPHKDYLAFVEKLKSTISMMVAYFNMRKSAKDFQKIQISKSGKLNADMLPYYKISEDLFLKTETMPEEKNHGFVIFIDWSGSMKDSIFSTFCQLLVILEFCRKLNIPFQVFGFTTGGGAQKISPKNPRAITASFSSCRIFKLIDSDLKTKEYRKVASQLYITAKNNPKNIASMGGTPLYAVALASDTIVHDFQEKYKTEKTMLILLSDGEANDSLHKANTTYTYGDKMTLRCPNSGKDYPIRSYHDVFQYVKDKNNLHKTVGFYLTDSLAHGAPADIVGSSTKYDNAEVQKRISQIFYDKKYFMYKGTTGFDKFYAVSIGSFAFGGGGVADSTWKNINEHDKVDKVIRAFKEKMSATKKNLTFMRFFVEEVG